MNIAIIGKNVSQNVHIPFQSNSDGAKLHDKHLKTSPVTEDIRFGQNIWAQFFYHVIIYIFPSFWPQSRCNLFWTFKHSSHVRCPC
jgi:hypothetical protein